MWECPPSEYLLYRVYDRSAKQLSEISQLSESDDPEVKRYLEVARSCSNIRSMYDSKWYYPTKEHDVVICSLEEVLSEALAYKGEKLKDRYALQAARAMFTLGRFRQMTDWWESVKDDLQDGAIKDSIEGYVAGALFRTGDEKTALEYYTEIGDVSSIIFCLKKKGVYEGDMSLLKYASEHCPDAEGVIGILQEYVTGLERYGWFKEKHKETEEFYEMCTKAAKRSKKPALWLYTAAFLKNQAGQPYVASNILNQAEKCNASTFLAESTKVLRIIIDAQIYPYDKAYESKLLNELRWLDNKILSDITENVREETAGIYSLKFCYSYYYWNDMMRRLVLGTVCPRMREAGKTPLALLLANYADNRLMMSVDRINVYDDGKVLPIELGEYRTSGRYFNDFDFSNHYFRMMDEVPLNHLVQYEALLMNPSSPIERFLKERSYVSHDYLMDIIGTRFIREQKYQSAVRYLSRVSDDYENRLNTAAYMDLDPFDIKKHIIRRSNGYKLNFARKMVDYDHIIQSCSDDDIRGEAMIKTGLGVRSSFTSCWALTHYSKSEYNPWFEDQYTLDRISRSHAIIEKGLNTIRDPELAARYYRVLCQWRTAAEKFPETEAAREIRTSCDYIVNYSYVPPKARKSGSDVNLYCR